MFSKMWIVPAALLAGAAITVGAACAQEGVSQIPKSGEKVEGAPFTVEREWGTFTLNERTAAKVRAGEPINYVFSYGSSSIPLFSPQYAIGAQMGCEMAQEIYAMNCAAIAPVQADVNQQVAQVEAKVAAGEIDCIGLSPSGDATTTLTNRLMDMGIPVFTVGTPSRAHEFTNFTQVPLKEGAQSAQAVLDWMATNNRMDIKVFAVSTGSPTAEYSIGRTKGFVETIKAAIADAQFITTDANPLNTTYDAAKSYDVYRSFLATNPNVQIIQNVDIGAEHADRAIEALGMTGKVFTIGWNNSYGQLDAIEKGIQIAAFDQRWPDQAGFGAVACAAFLKNGEILPNAQTLLPITKDNVAEARAQLDEMMKG
jgi:ribose transport system substrate-binding protein